MKQNTLTSVFWGSPHHPKRFRVMAGTTGLEPATSAVTGQRSNQLSYVPMCVFNTMEVCHIESRVSQYSLLSPHSTYSLRWIR